MPNPLLTAPPTLENAPKDWLVFVVVSDSLVSFASVDFSLASNFSVLASNSTINDSVAIDYPLSGCDNHFFDAPFCTRSKLSMALMSDFSLAGLSSK